MQKHDKEMEEKKQKSQAELSVLKTAVETGQLTPDAQAAAFHRMEEIVSEYGGGSGKKKGGFSLGNLIGRFGDTGGQQGGQKTQGGAGQNGAAGSSGSSAGIPGAEQMPGKFGQPTGAPEQMPGKFGGPPAKLETLPGRYGSGGPPTRGQMFGPGSFQAKPNKVDEISAEERARATARFQEEDKETQKRIHDAATEYRKANPQATNKDVYDNVTAPMLGIKGESKPDAKAEERKQEENDYMKAHASDDKPPTREQAEAAVAKRHDAEAEKKVEGKTTIGNEAGYPYPKTGDINKDLPAARAAFATGEKIREDTRAEAAQRADKKVAYRETSKTFAKAVADATTVANKAKATAEAKEKEIRKNNSTITGKIMGSNPDMVKAKAELAAAQQKVVFAKRAKAFIDQMEESVLEGKVDQQTVTDHANQLAETGKITSNPGK